MKLSPQKTDTEIDNRIDSISKWINHLQTLNKTNSDHYELIAKWQHKLHILTQAKEIIKDKGNGY